MIEENTTFASNVRSYLRIDFIEMDKETNKHIRYPKKAKTPPF
jgi:hypothetical protein